jgi:STE24 endopeptidase
MNETRSARYQRLRRRARVAGVASGLSGLALVALSPIGARLETLALDAGRAVPAALEAGVALAVFVALIVLIWELVAIPALLHLVVRVDRRYGTSRLSVEDVLGTQAQSVLLLGPVVLAAAASVRGALWVAGPWWWLLAAVLMAGGAVLAQRHTPAVIARLAGARPLAREALTRRLADLAAAAGVRIASVDELRVGRESQATAFVAGIGRARRIFVSEDVLQDWSDDEIAVVVAHELGHCVHQDAWRSMVLDVGVLAVALGGAGLLLSAAGAAWSMPAVDRLAALPALALVAGLIWLAATPLRHAQSRRHERRADAFALALTGGVDAFDAAIRRLGARHLADERPSAITRWLFYRHPSVGERLEYARAYREMTQV